VFSKLAIFDHTTLAECNSRHWQISVNWTK